MKKAPAKKLRVARETVRRIGNLDHVHGGTTQFPTGTCGSESNEQHCFQAD